MDARYSRRYDYDHRGFYLRVATGFSGYSDSIISKSTFDDGEEPEGLVSGVATVSELGIGGSLGRGVVLGGGIYSASVLATKEATRANQVVPSELRRLASVSLFGPFVDWYFQPDSGWHGQAALGFASLWGLQLDRPRIDDRKVAVGGGLMLGVGYEWAVSEQWAVGVLGRTVGAFLTETDSNDQRWYHLVGVSPSLMLSVTYY